MEVNYDPVVRDFETVLDIVLSLHCWFEKCFEQCSDLPPCGCNFLVPTEERSGPNTIFKKVYKDDNVIET